MKWMTALAALLIAATMTFAACGDDDDEGDGGGGEADTSEPAQLTITATDAAVDAPPSAAPGVTEVTLQNDSKKPATAQLLRIEGDHSEAEVVKVFNKVGNGGVLPAWMLGGGGLGTTKPGKSASVTQELEEGQYYVTNDEEGKISKKTYAIFEVSGDPGEAELPEGQTVTASEYTFESETLTAGEPVTFENVGKEPHHLVAVPLLPGKTAKDAERFFKTEKGPPPADFDAGVNTAVLDTDQALVSDDLGLKKGKYVLLCFISDRKGGPPHVAKGMIAEATVE